MRCDANKDAVSFSKQTFVNWDCIDSSGFIPGLHPWSENSSQLVVDAGKTSVDIGNLRAAVTYEIRVLANNSLGSSDPSNVVVVTTGQEGILLNCNDLFYFCQNWRNKYELFSDERMFLFHLPPNFVTAPNGPPREVHIEAVGSQRLHVTWSPPELAARNGNISGYYIGWRKYNSSVPFMYISKTSGLGEQLRLAKRIKRLFFPETNSFHRRSRWWDEYSSCL